MMDHPSDTTGTEAPGDGPATVLLRTPDAGPEPMPCPASDAERLLLVSLDGDADERLAARRTRDGLPAEVAVLVADETRSATAATGAAGPTTSNGGTQVSWASVDGPGDLAAIGEQIDRCLTSWADTGERVEVCVDSVSALLEAVDLPTAYRFLHVVMQRIDAADGDAHYHLGAGVEDGQVSATVETLFEHVLEYDPGRGSWVTPEN